MPPNFRSRRLLIERVYRLSKPRWYERKRSLRPAAPRREGLWRFRLGLAPLTPIAKGYREMRVEFIPRDCTMPWPRRLVEDELAVARTGHTLWAFHAAR